VRRWWERSHLALSTSTRFTTKILDSRQPTKWAVGAAGVPYRQAPMPELSRFSGIVIKVFYRDHPPPHFHAYSGSHAIKFRLAGGIVEGRLPRPALRLVRKWYDHHRMELERNWRLAQQGLPLRPIPPLDES